MASLRVWSQLKFHLLINPKFSLIKSRMASELFSTSASCLFPWLNVTSNYCLVAWLVVLESSSILQILWGHSLHLSVHCCVPRAQQCLAFRRHSVFIEWEDEHEHFHNFLLNKWTWEEIEQYISYLRRHETWWVALSLLNFRDFSGECNQILTYYYEKC